MFTMGFWGDFLLCALRAHHSPHLYYCAIIDFHAFLTKERGRN